MGKVLQFPKEPYSGFNNGASTVVDLMKQHLPSAEIIWAHGEPVVPYEELRRRQRLALTKEWCERFDWISKYGGALSRVLKNLEADECKDFTVEELRAAAREVASVAIKARESREQFLKMIEEDKRRL